MICGVDPGPAMVVVQGLFGDKTEAMLQTAFLAFTSESK